jgi:hypothetical protein
MSSAFDGYGHCALMLGAVAGYAAGKDFPALGNEFAQFADIFVIYDIYLIRAKLTYALFTAAASFLLLYHFKLLSGMLIILN